MRKIFFTVLLLSVAAISAFAQTVSALPAVPVSDGVIGSGEYAKVVTVDKTTLSYSLSPDGTTLYVAFEAPTTGWISVGFGSPKMTGADMIFAFVDAGVASITEETGKGHMHFVNKNARLISSAASETNGVTVLEAAIPAKDYVASGSLPVVLAFGKKDSRIAMHSWFSSTTISLR